MSWFRARVDHRARGVQAELAVDEGEVVAVVGPNGAGKSTLLKVIAGLLDADEGALELAGDDLWGVPAHRRRIVSLTQQAMRVLRAVSAPHGFNLGINQGAVAGAGIAAHLHQHVVPRWSGDANFLPVVGQTKALPQLLGQTWELVSRAWAASVPG